MRNPGSQPPFPARLFPRRIRRRFVILVLLRAPPSFVMLHCVEAAQPCWRHGSPAGRSAPRAGCVPQWPCPIAASRNPADARASQQELREGAQSPREAERGAAASLQCWEVKGKLRGKWRAEGVRGLHSVSSGRAWGRARSHLCAWKGAKPAGSGLERLHLTPFLDCRPQSPFPVLRPRSAADGKPAGDACQHPTKSRALERPHCSHGVQRTEDVHNLGSGRIGQSALFERQIPRTLINVDIIVMNYRGRRLTGDASHF